MQINSISFSGVSSSAAKKMVPPEYEALLKASLERIRLIRNELPRCVREDSYLRRHKQAGDIEVLLNELTRNINTALGKNQLYYHA